MQQERTDADVTRESQEAEDAGKGHDVPLARQHVHPVRDEV
jgi:hypothetical protein